MKTAHRLRNFTFFSKFPKVATKKISNLEKVTFTGQYSNFLHIIFICNIIHSVSLNNQNSCSRKTK